MEKWNLTFNKEEVYKKRNSQNWNKKTEVVPAIKYKWFGNRIERNNAIFIYENKAVPHISTYESNILQQVLNFWKNWFDIILLWKIKSTLVIFLDWCHNIFFIEEFHKKQQHMDCMFYALLINFKVVQKPCFL